MQKKFHLTEKINLNRKDAFTFSDICFHFSGPLTDEECVSFNRDVNYGSLVPAECEEKKAYICGTVSVNK